MLTAGELRYCRDIFNRVSRIREFLSCNELPDPPDPAEWHRFIAALRLIQGNLSNDGSFVATLLAKDFLATRHKVSFDAAEKPQGAPGIDISVTAPDSSRIVAEIKTTVPYAGSDFGAQQAASFKKDFAKLVASDADYKYLLVTDPNAYAVLKKPKYTRQMPGVVIVHLETGDQYAA